MRKRNTKNNEINFDIIKNDLEKLIDLFYEKYKDDGLDDFSKGIIFWMLNFKILSLYKIEFDKKFGKLSESVLLSAKHKVIEDINIYNNLQS